MSTLTRRPKSVCLAERLEELVTCAVCLKLLNNPKVFPCLHSYCFECIERLTEQEYGLACPECRAPVEIGNPPDLSTLPTNFFANNVLATLSLRDDNDAPALVCDNCEEPLQPVEKRCKECRQFLCEPCAESHQRSCDTKSHVLVSKDELKMNEPAENARAIKCNKHNEVIKFYCKTCQETICMVCTVLDHKQHNLVSVKESSAEAKEEVQNLVQKVEERMETILAGITLALQKSHDINAREKACNAQIETFFTNLHAEIEAEKLNMLVENASAAEGQRSQVNVSKGVLELALSTCQNGANFAKQTLKNGDDVQLLDIKPTITQYLVNLKSVQDHTVPTVGNPIRFLKTQSLTQICQHLTSFICSEEVAVCPEKCEAKLSADALLKVGKKSVIIIVLKDKDGRNVSSGSGNDQIEPTFADVAIQDVEISENQDGTHEISFVVKELGTLQFEAKINGCVAPGCSLKMDVKWELSDVYGNGYLLRSSGQIVDCMSGEDDVGKYPFRMGDTPITSGVHYWKVEMNHAVQNVQECYKEGPIFEVGVIEASDDYTETSIKNGMTKRWVYSGQAKKFANVFLYLDMEKRTLLATSKFSFRRKPFEVTADVVFPFVSVTCPHCSVMFCNINT